MYLYIHMAEEEDCLGAVYLAFIGDCIEEYDAYFKSGQDGLPRQIDDGTWPVSVPDENAPKVREILVEECELTVLVYEK